MYILRQLIVFYFLMHLGMASTQLNNAFLFYIDSSILSKKSTIFSMTHRKNSTEFVGLAGIDFISAETLSDYWKDIYGENKNRNYYSTGLSINQSLFSHSKLSAGFQRGWDTKTRRNAYSTGFNQTFNDEMTTLGMSYKFTSIHQPRHEVLTKDLDIIEQQTRNSKNNFSLSWFQILSKTGLLTSQYHFLSSADSANGHLLSTEWRKYIDSLTSALHIQATGFFNTGTLPSTSIMGKMWAYSISPKWSSYIGNNFIGMVFYRYYHEVEHAKSDNFDRQLGSDLYGAKLSYDFNICKLDLVYNYYENNNNVHAHTMALGVSITN